MLLHNLENCRFIDRENENKTNSCCVYVPNFSCLSDADLHIRIYSSENVAFFKAFQYLKTFKFTENLEKN